MIYDHPPYDIVKGVMNRMLVFANAMIVLLFSDNLFLWLILCMAMVLGEGGLFYLFKRKPLWRAFRDSLIVNTLSILLGFGLGVIPFFQGNPDSPIPDIVTPLLFLMAAWGLSVVAEGGSLTFLDRTTGCSAWSVALLANTLSGIVIFGLAVVLVFFIH
jgi:hypothetical protein